MENGKNEKIKKIRRILLLKINDELKDILKNKSNIRINSKTIPELNKLYTLNDIKLYEKPALYSHYVKTEESIIPRMQSQEKPIIKISKSVNKIRTKNKSRANINVKIEKVSFEEDSVSPLNSFFPKKVELGNKKMPLNKSKNKGSIPNIHHKGIKLEKYNETKHVMISQSTKMGKRDLHLNRLIGRITVIKDNKITEDIIMESIKKLRNLCYQLRKMKKRPKKLNNNNYNQSKKSMDKMTIKKRNALKEGLLKKSDTLNTKLEPTHIQNYLNKARKNALKSPNINIIHKLKKLSKISKITLSPSKRGDKEEKAIFSFVKKGKVKKNKKSNKNSIKTAINITTFESNEVPDINTIHKKGLAFFHKTTVEIDEDDIQDKEKKERKRSDKKTASKEKSEKIERNEKIFQRKKSKIFDQQPLVQLPQEANNAGSNSKFLNLNYVYGRNNNKKNTNTKIEMTRVPSNKKLTKIEIKGKSKFEGSPPIIKISKVNNGEIQKKIKKRPVKEKRINRNSYISNKTDTQNYISKENVLQKSVNKKQ